MFNENDEIKKQKTIDLMKQIYTNEYYLKIEKDKYQKEKAEYEKELKFINEEIDIANESLEKCLKNLNDKEQQIYEIQTDELRQIMNEIQSVEKMKNLMVKQISNKTIETENDFNDILILYNHNFMLYNDIICSKKEIERLEQSKNNCLNDLQNIKKSYPPNFEFFLDDYVSETKIAELVENIKKINYEIDKSYKDLAIYSNEIEKEKTNYSINENEFNKLNEELENTFNEDIEDIDEENEIKKIESDIENKIYQSFEFNLYKKLLEYYLKNKDFKLNSKVDVTLLVAIHGFFQEILSKYNENIKGINDEIQKINLKLGIFKKEKKTKNKEAEKLSLENDLKPLTIEMKLLEKIANELQNEIMPNYDINKIMKENKKDVENVNKNHSIIRLDFDDNFKNDIITIISTCPNEILENNPEIKSDMKKYINLLEEKFKRINEINYDKNKYNDTLLESKNKIDNLNKLINDINFNIPELKRNLEQQNTEIKLLNNEIFERSIVNNKKLAKLPVEDFECYLKSNLDMYKNMKKSGIKLNKKNELNITKEQFIDYVLSDHTNKKNKAHLILENIYKIKKQITINNKDYDEIVYKQNKTNELYIEAVDKKDRKNKEIILLRNSCNQTDNSIKDNLQEIQKNMIEEKEKLRNEFNIDFYKNLIKDKTFKLEYLNNKKNKLVKNFDFKNEDSLKKIKQMENALINLNKEKINLCPPKFDKLIQNEIILYKKTSNEKNVFKLSKANEFPPDKCGYVFRSFIIDPKEQNLLIKNNYLRQIEMKIKLKDIQSIVLYDEAKKYEKKGTLDQLEFIPFYVMFKGGRIDLISNNYLSYNLFLEAIQDIIDNSSSLKDICKRYI